MGLHHHVEKMLQDAEFKLFFSIIAAVIAFIEGIYGQILWGFLGLVAIDFITGIMKSKKNGIPITSRRLRGSVTKLGAYMALITAFIIAGYFEPTLKPVVNVIYIFSMLTELKSIAENVEELGVKIPEKIKGLLKDRTEHRRKDEDK